MSVGLDPLPTVRFCEVPAPVTEPDEGATETVLPLGVGDFGSLL